MKRTILMAALFLTATAVVMAGGSGDTGMEPGAQDSITYVDYLFYDQPEQAKAFEDQFYRDTGVKLITVSVPKEDATDKIQAMMVSGDFSDVCLVSNNVIPLIRQGFIVPIEDYVNQHPGFKRLRTTSPSFYAEAIYNNKIYGVASGTGSYMNYWVRGDWLETLGLKVPDTMDGIVKMLQAFKDAPFNAGKEVIPLVLTNSIWNHDVFSTYWGVFNEVVKIGGKYRDDYLTPKFKEYMDFMRNLYERGLLDKEMPTNGYGGSRTKFHTGLGGSIVMWDDIYDNLEKGMINNNIDGEAIPVPPFKGPDGVFGLSYSPPGVSYAISKGAKNPKFVFDTFFDWIFLQPGGIIASSRGIEGYNFTIVDGMMTPTGKGNVGFWGQKFPPVLLEFSYPFKLDRISQTEYDDIVQVRKWADPFRPQVDKLYMPPDSADYWSVEGDLYDKKSALVGKYIIGDIDYSTFSKEYSQYIKEIGLAAMIAAVN